LLVRPSRQGFLLKTYYTLFMILTETTRGIRISVQTQYQTEHSRPSENRYVFAYRITIENCSEYTVQVLRRHWKIYDSNGCTNDVEGVGVVGQQPVIPPGSSHQYVSWANLGSDIGKMLGTYRRTPNR
jgi:ApaG protein